MDYPIRKLPRLAEYDYATPGAYFITICTHNKQCLFGKILQDNALGEPHMQYSAIGEIAKTCLLDIESHYDNIKIVNWVIMPNHVHMLVQITERINPFPTVKPYGMHLCIPLRFSVSIAYQKKRAELGNYLAFV